MLKEKIKQIVDEYIEVFNKEYTTFCNSMINKRDLQANEYASGVAGGQFAYEIPETLDHMFHDMLIEEERREFRTKEMTLWFGRTFSQFSPAIKI